LVAGAGIEPASADYPICIWGTSITTSPKRLNRLALATIYTPHGIAAATLSLGWMRTEPVPHAFKADEGDWRQVEALPPPNRRRTSGARSWPRPATGG
jgi:hypothetical protein